MHFFLPADIFCRKKFQLMLTKILKTGIGYGILLIMTSHSQFSGPNSSFLVRRE